nr:CRE-GLB-12 protein [Haemonchus contortus]
MLQTPQRYEIRVVFVHRNCLVFVRRLSQFKKLDDPKDIVGLIFVDIVNDIAPELKKVFGVERAPKAGMLKMPKFGGHVARFTELIEQTTTMLGFTENLSGAWQLVRKTGRIHVKQSFLEQNQNQLEKNYFDVVLTTFIECFIPYLTGEKVCQIMQSYCVYIVGLPTYKGSVNLG